MGRSARFAIGRGDRDVAAKPDDMVEVKLLGRQPVELMIAEAAVGDDADLDLRRQDLSQPHQQAVLIEIALILQGFLVHRQPDEWRGATVFGDQRQHDGGLVVGVEVGSVHGDRDGGAGTDDIGHPQGQDVINLDAGVG